MELNDPAFKIFIAALGTAYTVVFGLIANKMWNIPSEIEAKLEEFKAGLERKFEKLELESKGAHQRIDAHDRISSKIIGEEFDSRAISQHGRFPIIKKFNYDN